MKVVVATASSTLILCERASLLASPTVVPASTVPCRWIVLVRARIASRSVVLPAWNGPTSATHLGPLAPPLPLPAIVLPPSANRGPDQHRFRETGGLARGGCKWPRRRRFPLVCACPYRRTGTCPRIKSEGRLRRDMHPP